MVFNDSIATEPNRANGEQMKQVQHKCRGEAAEKRQLVKWLRDETMTGIGLDRTESGFTIYATKIKTKPAALAAAEA